MARIQPVNFQMNYRIECCTNIRGHHVYKASWAPGIGERVICFIDICSEAPEYDTHVIGVCKKVEEPDEKLKLVRHIPIECSSLLDYSLKADRSNKLIATVEGKRKREIGFVVRGKLICCTKQLLQASILYREPMEKELNIVIFK